MPMRPCNNCRTIFTYSGRSPGLCPGCRRAGWRAHQAQRPRHGEEYGRVWRRLRQAVLLRDGCVCAYCGGVAGTVDAIFPRSRGGVTSPCNAVACCSPCNTSKGDRTVGEWIASGCAPSGLRERLADDPRFFTPHR